MSLKSVIRSGKNFVNGYSDTQIKTRQATSNDTWGPSGTLMADIAHLAYQGHHFMEIMDIIDKRLNDSGKNWRHVYKALILLHYLLENGPDQVISHAKSNLQVIKTLKEFQYIDEEGRDQGANVRQKCKEVTALLTDDSKLSELRKNKGARYSADRFIHGRFDEDDEEMRLALEASKKQMEIDNRKRYGGISEDDNMSLQEQQDLQRALELSEREAIEREKKNRDLMQQKENPNDNILDFFGSLESPQQPQTGYDPFAGFGGMDPFAQQQMQQQQLQQQMLAQQMWQMEQQQMEQQRLQMEQQRMQQMEQQRLQMEQQRMQQQMEQQRMQQQNAFAGNPFGQFSTPPPQPLDFVAAKQKQQQQNPNLSSNLKTIDPFANLANNRPSYFLIDTRTGPNIAQEQRVGSGSNPFGQSNTTGISQPFGSSNPSSQSQSSQPFGSSNPSSQSQSSQPFGSINPSSQSQSSFGQSNAIFGGSQISSQMSSTSQPFQPFDNSAASFTSSQKTQPFGNQFGSNQSAASQNLQSYGVNSQQNQPFGAQSNQSSFASQSNQPFNNIQSQPFGAPFQKELVNMDVTGMSSKPLEAPSKNPFSTSNNNKFQWEPSKPPGPTLAQLQSGMNPQSNPNAQMNNPMNPRNPMQQQGPFF